jgi:4-hydroxybenzoate polyprenyltransferase
MPPRDAPPRRAGLRTIGALARATHLGPTLAVTSMAAGLAAASGVRGGRLALLGAAVLAGQASVGWSNDVVDRHRDRAAGRADKPVAAGDVGARTVAASAGAALVLCAALSLALGPVAAAAHLGAVGVAWAYNLGLKGTPASPLPYAAAFALLPVVVAATAGGRAPAWVLAGAALLGAGAHCTNTLPDVEHDAATGVAGLPQRLGPRRSAVAGALLLGAGGAVAAAGLAGAGALGTAGMIAAGLGAALVVAVLVVGLRRADRLAFTLSMGAAAAVVVLLATAGPLLGPAAG